MENSRHRTIVHERTEKDAVEHNLTAALTIQFMAAFVCHAKWHKRYCHCHNTYNIYVNLVAKQWQRNRSSTNWVYGTVSEKKCQKRVISPFVHRSIRFCIILLFFLFIFSFLWHRASLTILLQFYDFSLCGLRWCSYRCVCVRSWYVLAGRAAANRYEWRTAI